MDNSMVATTFAEVNGAQLAYEVAGDGFPLVLIHSVIADMTMWQPQWAALSQHYRTIRYDLRGFGQSLLVPEHTFRHTDDLAALLDYLGVERAHVMGCSGGGSIALDFTLVYPQLVASLISEAGGVEGADVAWEQPPQWDALVTASEAGDLEAAAELNVQIWVDGVGRSPQDVDPAIRNLIRAADVIALKNEAARSKLQIDPEPAAERLTEVTVPTLYIYGDYDQLEVASTADYVANNVRGARKHLIPDTAHFPNLEQPDEFNRVVLEFLRDVEEKPRA